MNGLTYRADIFTIMFAMNKGKFVFLSSFFTAYKGKICGEKLIMYDYFDMM